MARTAKVCRSAHPDAARSAALAVEICTPENGGSLRLALDFFRGRSRIIPAGEHPPQKNILRGVHLFVASKSDAIHQAIADILAKAKGTPRGLRR